MKRIIYIAILIAVAMSADAIEVSGVIGDNMVLQQNCEVCLWGWSEPNGTINVKPSWSKHTYRTRSDKNGCWEVRVTTPIASLTNYFITFKDKSSAIIVRDVLIGEVWFCSGQSNMEMPVKGWNGQPVEGSIDAIMLADETLPIRHCAVSRTKSFNKQENCQTVWSKNTSEGVAGASAIAYFFAKRLCEVQKVPVGVINASWGGTSIESWMSKEVLDRQFKGEIDMSAYETETWPKENNGTAPGTLYNTMLHPLLKYTFKGFLWYQGENDRFQYEKYSRLQPAFVEMLRNESHNAEMPFYYTQIAPYGYSKTESEITGCFMWMQAQNQGRITNSAMACIHDLGELSCIHPRKKQEAAARLANIALARTYGRDIVDVMTPIAKSFTFVDGKAIVTFNVGKQGMSPIHKKIGGFELAGEDHIFYPATGFIYEKDSKQVVVTSDSVPNPIAVRYAITRFCTTTLYNSYGVPASPFRSDNW